MNANPTPRPSRSPGWTTVLALISLVLSGLLWLSGLVDSLQRPSVGNDLELRQQELAALAAPGLPPSLGRALAGEHRLDHDEHTHGRDGQQHERAHGDFVRR